MEKTKPIKPVSPGDLVVPPTDEEGGPDVTGGQDRPDPFSRGLGTEPAQK